MIWNICFCLSLSVLGAVVLGGLLLHHHKTGKTLLMSGVFLSVFILLVPISFINIADSIDFFKALIININKTLRTFAFSDLESLSEAYRDGNGIYGIYSAFLLFMSFLCPFLSAGYIFSFMKKTGAALRFSLSCKREMIVFSTLSKDTLTLACDLHKSSPEAVIVFAGLDSLSANDISPLAKETEALRPILLYKDLKTLRFSKNKKLMIFAAKEDENENLSDAEALIASLKDHKNTQIFFFNSNSEGRLLMNTADKGFLKLRRIDLVSSTVNTFLYEEGTVLFDTATKAENTRKISVLILGSGDYGRKLLKSLCWYLQMTGFEFEINAYDNALKAKDELKFQCPELIDNPLYNVNIHHLESFAASSFSEVIKKHGNTTFVFIDTSNDQKNSEIAINTRTLFERNGKAPLIYTVISDNDISNNLTKAVTHKNESYDIRILGTRRRTFSQKQILKAEVEKAALGIHLKWGDEESFWKHEYNYSSSVSAAIHQKARKYLNLQPETPHQDTMSKEDIRNLQILEHQRWSAYMRSIGYVYGSEKNDLAMTHNNLTDIDSLNEADKQKDLNWLNN